jgi:hypothetical protein
MTFMLTTPETMAETTPETMARIDPDTHHWEPLIQRAFLEQLAECGTVRGACGPVGKSCSSAYRLRIAARGAALRLGWDAAVLIARAQLIDTLMERALHGQEEIVTRSDETTTRRRHDNRLAMAMLARLDRIADRPSEGASDEARIVAQDFEAFLDLVEAGGDGDAVRAFVAARAPAQPAAIEVPEQCELLEQTDGNITRQVAQMSVWFDDIEMEWRTSFPLPEGEDPEDYPSERDFGERDYWRATTEQEDLLQDAIKARADAALLDAAHHARRAWFAEADADGAAVI